MSGAWTPGPWRAHREKNGVSSLRSADGTPIIEVDCLELGREVSPDVWFETTPEDLALMAAAPDLLDALEAYYSQHKCGCNHPACNDCERDRIAEAALAKARGETP